MTTVPVLSLVPVCPGPVQPLQWFISGSLAGAYIDAMTNANRLHRNPWRTASLVGALVVSAALPATAQSSVETDPDDAVTGEAISELGRQHGLELYARDAADPCRADRMQVRVVVNGVKAGGIMKLELFGENDFMKSSGKLRKVRVPAADAPLLVCMDVPEPGEYAVVGYHDLDGDRKLDKKWNFKPKEPYGLSNNPRIESLRLPKWEETRFSVPMEGTNITINLVDLS